MDFLIYRWLKITSRVIPCFNFHFTAANKILFTYNVCERMSWTGWKGVWVRITCERGPPTVPPISSEFAQYNSDTMCECTDLVSAREQECKCGQHTFRIDWECERECVGIVAMRYAINLIRPLRSSMCPKTSSAHSTIENYILAPVRTRHTHIQSIRNLHFSKTDNNRKTTTKSTIAIAKICVLLVSKTI